VNIAERRDSATKDAIALPAAKAVKLTAAQANVLFKIVNGKADLDTGLGWTSCKIGTYLALEAKGLLELGYSRACDHPAAHACRGCRYRLYRVDATEAGLELAVAIFTN
jgi:hypothetical protein